MRLDVFGREVEVVRRRALLKEAPEQSSLHISNEEWQVYYCGNEGKKRPANDIKLPADLPESEIVTYLADLCHEWATADNNCTRVIKP